MTDKKFTIEIAKSTIVMTNAMLKTFQAESKWYGKIIAGIATRIDQLLIDYPGNTYRVTVESIDEEKST